MDLTATLRGVSVVPVIVVEAAEQAVPVVAALAQGGLQVAEITLRTACAADAIASVASELPQVIVGAGTVLNVAQYEVAVAAGAGFVVSPGLDEALVERAQRDEVPIYPGVATPTELQRACNLGLDTVKFFPAAQAGGIPMLKALSSVFGSISFIPTGGISADNLADYLSLDCVLACGGSWLTPRAALRSGDFSRITELGRQAVAIAGATRPEA